MSLSVCPISFREAATFVAKHHRHHMAPVGHKFSIAVTDGDQIVGVAMVGRPVARFYDDGLTLEVNRTCTDGARNANSMLYGAAWKATKALGYRRLITYTRADESGSSLRAAGWRIVAERSARGRRTDGRHQRCAVSNARAGWNTPSKPRVDTTEHGLQRTLWEVS